MHLDLDAPCDDRPAQPAWIPVGLKKGTYACFGGGAKPPPAPKIQMPKMPEFKMPAIPEAAPPPPPAPPPPNQTVTSDVQQASNDARTQALRRKGTRSTIFAGETGPSNGALGGGSSVLG